MLKTLTIATLAISTLAFAGGTIPPKDAYQVRYAANMNIGDSVVNLTNTGTVNGTDPAGNICANVYVFAEDQQMVSCCSCPLTPNHLKTLSVRNDLISNTLTPGVPIGVTIALLASLPLSGNCYPGGPLPVGALVSGLRAWGTTIHAAPDGTYHVTETPFSQVQLPEDGGTEFTKLVSYCGFIHANGSGYGLCKSCREGAQGAARQ